MSISRFTFLLAVLAAGTLSAARGADDLAASVAGRLRDTAAVEGHRVTVRAKSGTVWLEGQVGDRGQIDAALAAAESVEGVERVVNRLSITESSPKGVLNGLAVPGSVRAIAGGTATPRPGSEPARLGPAATEAAQPTVAATTMAEPRFAEPAAKPSRLVQLAQAIGLPTITINTPSGPRATAPRNGVIQSSGATRTRQDVAMRSGMMRRGAMGGYDQTVGGMVDGAIGNGAPGMMPGGMPAVGDGQVVPGSIRYSQGGPVGGPMAGQPGVGPGSYGPMAGGPGGGLGAPMPMGGAGVGMPPVPMRGEGPNLPNYAWPSYASYPNYAALQYPTQYSPTAWPYIGPFYPYPQVPLGWRRVSLEWDDGWWWLDFDDRHYHSHH
jgi:hypothetical protein